MQNSVISVTCSSRENFVQPLFICGPTWIAPSGSMSGSGQCPAPMYADQRWQMSNSCFSSGQLSQKSSVSRHRLAWVATCGPASSGVAPGEVLSTMGRPQPSMAWRMASISALCWLYGRERSSTLT